MKHEANAWDEWSEAERLAWLTDELSALAVRMRGLESRLSPRMADVDAEWRRSAENLSHYLALRHEDVRVLQTRLSELGLSSLGRSEPHVLASVGAVLGLLERVRGAARTDLGPSVGIAEGRERLMRHADALFGPPRPHHRVRIMVTMPSEAADDAALVRALVAVGMDVMRINCAHDDAAAWRRMVGHLHAANSELHASCRVQFDLPGPKLRTGDFDPGPQVMRWRPTRDARGNVVTPARVRFESTRAGQRPTSSAVRVPPSWLAHASVGRAVTFHDLRGKRRSISLVGRDETSAWGDASQGAWIGPSTEFEIETAGGKRFKTAPHDLPALPGEIRVAVGQRVRLVGPEHQGRAATASMLATVSCTLPEALAALKVGHRVFFDDGKIGGVVEEVERGGAVVRLTDGPPNGARLAADKGINLPDTHLPLPALGEVDLAALDVATELGDLVALSFARTAADVEALHAALTARHSRLGVVLKVENREGFENLSALLMAAMKRPPFGVMIARGDLAVECGFARLAELQEEMLCLCEAAHAPVVWATQVLETAARKGFPSRAEVTDAAMGERAECVMLNKGPFVVQAVRTLDDILRRMESHQMKKTPLFRRLRSLGVD